jgi:hypothetical protein
MTYRGAILNEVKYLRQKTTDKNLSITSQPFTGEL